MDTNLKCFQLKINTGDKASEIFVLDSQFHLIAKGCGDETIFKLNAGSYIVQVKSGTGNNEKSIALSKDTSINFEPIKFSSPVPLENTYQTSDLKLQTSSDYSRRKKSDVIIGKGSKLFLFGSIPQNLHSSDWPNSNTDPAIGLTLRNFKDEILIDFSDPKIGTYSWEGEPWAACDIDLNPGNYVLCVETTSGNTYKQTIVTCATWQTQVFLQPRNYGINEKDIRADLFNSSILMSKIEYGFNPKETINFNDGTNYRLTEQIRQSFKNKRNTVNKELMQTLFSGELDNPMLGLYSTHLLLQNTDFVFSEIKIIVKNLRRLLGKSHPDVEAIALKMRMPTKHKFIEFPMFANSWNFVLEAAIKNPYLIPSDATTYKLSGQFWSNESWLIWGKNKEVERGGLKQELVGILQQKIKNETSKDFIKTVSQVTRAIASNKNVKQKIQKYLPSYKKALDNAMSTINAEGIMQVTQSLGIPHQKVSDLIERINLDDLTSAVKKFNVQLSSDNDDPQKGKWGGKSKNNFRKMTASVLSSTVPGLYNVIINVASTKKDIPLEGEVKFHLHDTFLNPTPIVPVEEGKATLKLSAVWGSFTVGAEIDDGNTQLELDLSELPNVSNEFRER